VSAHFQIYTKVFSLLLKAASQSGNQCLKQLKGRNAAECAIERIRGGSIRHTLDALVACKDVFKIMAVFAVIKSPVRRLD